jgi:mono/diheme cytochrome c family protein
MIVQRGYKKPPSLHDDRLRQAPHGYLYQTITNGFGVMPSYAAQMHERDRWAVVAYLRALQLSQYGLTGDVPAEDLRRLEEEEEEG